ncbi:MAG TPA: CBS domain-containing protein [Steroidobacteraceae bacterium]|nr:CBS domain-containing protein [Steroidobacteraceae bacterium]
MLLKDICTPDVVHCPPETTAIALARLMRERHVGDVVVVEEGEGDQTPLGVVTDRDIVVEVLGRERDPARVSAREIMRKPVVIARTSEDAAQAVERMKAHGVRRIPVLDEQRRLAGIVCLDDLLKQLAADAVALADIVSREQDREHRLRR